CGVVNRTLVAVKAGRIQGARAQVRIEVGKFKAFAKEVAVDIREVGQRFVKIGLASVERCVQHFKEASAVPRQFADILKGLRFGFVEVLTQGFMLDEHEARPEEVNA